MMNFKNVVLALWKSEDYKYAESRNIWNLFHIENME